MNEILKAIAPRIVQDLITASATYLTAHGIITGSQTQDFIGAAFFLGMLIVNSVFHLNDANTNYNKGVVDTTVAATQGIQEIKP